MIKDVVVNLSTGAERGFAGLFAISVAAACEAHLDGIAFAYDPIVPPTLMGGIPPDFIETQRRETEQAARTAVATFEAAAGRAGVLFGARAIAATVADAAARFAAMARRFDIAVVGQVEPERGVADGLIAETALFESGRPI